jgi:glycosyltransferase involved in cell wall biosynthesis
MRALDVGLITSTRSEAICRVALEYMSMGLPVIASDTNILPEVVTAGETGWIFANEDAEALANILGEAIQNRAELKRRGAAGARAVRAQFTLAHEADRYLEIFATAQAGREKRA